VILRLRIDGGIPVSQNLSQQASSSAHDELEVSLADILAPLRRHWKLVVIGTGVCWAILLLVVLMVPRFTPPTYRCDAALSLPSVIPPTRQAARVIETADSSGLLLSESTPGEGPWATGARAGIPLVLYKELERALLDGAAMRAALSGKLPPTAVDGIQRGLAEHVAPVPNSPKDDPQKLEKDDTITAVRLSYEAPRADQATEIVGALAGLVREALITAIARQEIGWDARTSDEQVLGIIGKKADLLDVNRSLERLSADLERLKRDMPMSQAAGSRQVVDTRQHGYLYLPPELQLVGAKARHAENEHSIRVYDEVLARHTLRLSFLRRLDERIGRTGTAVVPDIPKVIGSELQGFLHEPGNSGPETRYLQTEMEALRDELATFRNATQFIQYPTTTRMSGRSHTSLAAALASLAVVFFFAAAFVADLWRPENSAVPSKSP
jgi:hypothetical protein